MVWAAAIPAAAQALGQAVSATMSDTPTSVSSGGFGASFAPSYVKNAGAFSDKNTLIGFAIMAAAALLALKIWRK